jgi:hypothetical protein
MFGAMFVVVFGAIGVFTNVNRATLVAGNDLLLLVDVRGGRR